jgi:uncharacterized protein with GYD domain
LLPWTLFGYVVPGIVPAHYQGKYLGRRYSATPERGEINARQREVITQGRFKREYISGGLARPEDRQAAISKLCEQVGGKLVLLYFTLGQYDFMVVSEMPDAQAAAILAFVATGGGGIEGSVTTQAFTTVEAKDMFEAAGKLAGSYKPMGAS